MDGLVGARRGEVGGAPAGHLAARCPRRRRRCRGRTPARRGRPRRPASPSSNSPSTSTHAGGQQRRRRARRGPGGHRRRPRPCRGSRWRTRSTACGPAAAGRCAWNVVPSPTRRPPRRRARRAASASAITARTPDHEAMRAAASFDAMPPLPRDRARAAGRRTEHRVVGRRPRRRAPRRDRGGDRLVNSAVGVGEQHEQRRRRPGGRRARRCGRCRRSGSRRRRWRRSR